MNSIFQFFIDVLKSIEKIKNLGQSYVLDIMNLEVKI